MIVNSKYVGGNLLFVLKEIQRDWNVECTIELKTVITKIDGKKFAGLYHWGGEIEIATEGQSDEAIIKIMLHETAHYQQYRDGFLSGTTFSGTSTNGYQMSTRASEREAVRFAQTNLPYFSSMLYSML